MRPFRLVLLLIACTCFTLSGFGVGHAKLDLKGLGLALCALAALISL